MQEPEDDTPDVDDDKVYSPAPALAAEGAAALPSLHGCGVAAAVINIGRVEVS